MVRWRLGGVAVSHHVRLEVFRTILKKHNLAAGDFPEIQSFASKLGEVKFSEFSNFSQKKIDELDQVLNVEIPKLMAVSKVSVLGEVLALSPRTVTFQELPSERDSPESLRAKMSVPSSAPVPYV